MCILKYYLIWFDRRYYSGEEFIIIIYFNINNKGISLRILSERGRIIIFYKWVVRFGLRSGQFQVGYILDL